MSVLHIKSDLTPVIEAFKSYTKPRISIRMEKQQISNLISIVEEFFHTPSQDDLELEIIILKEIRQLLLKKYHIISNRANVDFNCSQARTLFLWLNNSHFEHPLKESLSCWVIDQIYRQII